MGNELSGKVAVVTGGASGIGAAAVARFVAEGARVVIADVDCDRGAALASDFGADCLFKATDVSDAAQIAELVSATVEHFGGLHIMFNNAGVSGAMHQSLFDEDFQDFRRIMDVNVLGVMLGTQHAARHMAAHGGGAIINTTSIGGIQAGRAVLTYRASKAAVIQFSKSAAIDVAEHFIRVNCIAPGGIPTPILSEATAGLESEGGTEVTEALRVAMLADRPIKRNGTTADIANAAVFLASDRSTYITGTVLPVDGGTVAGNANNPMPTILQRLTTAPAG
ncbi:SDR family NAD(P)-dependent oxidoreductase [Nocardia callitridis]|uniref:SDR family oxidoreductase n=1 Tax=Nocardia callitridis TaxID=648753 RepID=A0ABP9KE34_9NOCA